MEVVHVTYDRNRLSYEDLSRLGRRGAEIAFVKNDEERRIATKYYGRKVYDKKGKVRRVQDTKYYLQQSQLQYLPLTELQAIRLNANRSEATQWLSPRQRELLELIQRHPKAGWKKFDDERRSLLERWNHATRVADDLRSKKL